MGSDFDLDPYFQRIGFGGEVKPRLDTLCALHFAHATTIPFENLDIQMGLPIRLDLASLQEKLVLRRRGGYCFEQNTLFLAALKAIGFDVVPCEARVRLGAPEILPRTHMLLVLQMEGAPWLCDVGFGGEGLLHPVPMDGEVHGQFMNAYRVMTEGSLRVLQSRHDGAWTDLYAFHPEPRFTVDFEVANHYTSTHPESRFVKTLTAQLPGPQVRRILRNRAYAEIRGDSVEGSELALDEVLPMLRESFGILVPDGARFKAFEG